MNKKKLVILIGLLFTLSILAPKSLAQNPNNLNHPRTIKIGVITATYSAIQVYQDLYGEIVGPDINDYLSRLPTMGNSPHLRVEFIVEGPSEDDYWLTAARHLEIVQEMSDSGIEYFIAGFWSSHAAGSLDYINENGLLMVSPSSSSPALKYDDNLFRLAPADDSQAVVLCSIFENYDEGIDSLVCLYREDNWGTGLATAVDDIFEGDMVSIPYPPCIDPDDPECMPDSDFTTYLAQADTAAANLPGNVGFLLIAFDENVDILQQAPGFSTLYGLPWFSTESSGRSQLILEEAAEEACHVSLISALGAPPDSPIYSDLAERYEALGHGPASFYLATAVDAAWLITDVVLDTTASSINPTASDAVPIFREKALRYYGYSGWTVLNEYGDRDTVDSDIWGFGPDENGEPSIIKYGSYDSVSGELRWEHTHAPWEDGC